MPSLAELSDYYPQTDNTLPVAQPYLGVPQDADGLRRVYINTAAPAQLPSVAAPITDARPEPLAEPISPQSASITDKLFGLNGQERYQLWPEKVVREALAAPHDAMNTTVPVTSEDLIAPAQAVSALAGTGGLAGAGEGAGAALGAGPMLRPALKYEGKIYKAPIKDADNPLGFGAEHSDAIPAHLADDFYKKAMSGEDINHYDFGFMNHKGQFLKREDALDYGIKEGLIDPQNAKYGTLTSTMLADSSKPGTAIESLAKSDFKIKPPKILYRGITEGAQENGASGLGTSHLGKGLYTSADKSFAKKYASRGDIREFTPEDAFPKNPLVLNGAGGAGSLLMDHIFKNTNFKNAREFNKAYPDIGAYVRELGHDGVVTNGGEEIVKYPQSLFADSSKPGTAIEAMAKTTPFYSALEHNVNAISQGKMTGEQWLGTLSNKPGVKPEELDWTGVKSFLEEKGKQPVTKQELQEYLQNNKVEIKDVDKGGGDVEALAKKLGEEENGVGSWDRIGGGGQEHYYRDARKELGTKYHSYQLPGGENYREKLLTLPKDAVGPLVAKRQALDTKIEDLRDSMRGTSGSDAIRAEIRKAQIEKDIVNGNLVKAKSETYKSSHWDEPNILAHVRMNDRIIDGKKSLHIEEIQSDFLQAHRNEQAKIVEAVNKDFDGIADRMVKAGVIKKICD